MNATALAFAMTAGAMVGLVFVLGSRAAKLRAAESRLQATEGRAQPNFMLLLKKAKDEDILRRVGLHYQFRHGEMQDQLAAAQMNRRLVQPLGTPPPAQAAPGQPLSTTDAPSERLP